MSMHHGLAAGRWGSLTLFEQLGNVGSEVGRATNARARNDAPRFEGAFVRAMELFDLTLADPRWSAPRLREIARAREVTCDFLVGENDYGSTADWLDGYFLQFAIAARRSR
jgi:hypothetical protein